MKKFIRLLVLLLLAGYNVFAQDAVLHVSLANSKATLCTVFIPVRVINDHFNFPLDGKHTGSYTFKLSKPEFISVHFSDGAEGSDKHFEYLFYLSPGDNLRFSTDLNAHDFNIKVSGKGSVNNQPLLSIKEDKNFTDFRTDTLPYRAINKINADQKIQEARFAKYIRLYHPSSSYIKDWGTNIRYYAFDQYKKCEGSIKNNVWDAYYRNYDKWRHVTDSLASVAKLSNDDALNTPHYLNLLGNFLYWETIHLEDEEYLHPVAFYKEWYKTDTIEGKKQFKTDVANRLQERIINRYFTGKTEEYMYAEIFAGAINESYIKNIPGIFERFKKKYPRSKYIAQFSETVNEIVVKEKRTLNDKMVFLPDNGIKLNTLEELIVAMKGKTVLVDMWGTWCGPCREEIEKNSAAIREHFKGKGLTYLYIATKDLDHEQYWKKLIALLRYGRYAPACK